MLYILVLIQAMLGANTSYAWCKHKLCLVQIQAMLSVSTSLAIHYIVAIDLFSFVLL